MRTLELVWLLSLIGGCATATPRAEVAGGYSYVPLDPFPAQINVPEDCSEPSIAALQSLPDNAVRMSVVELAGSAKTEAGFGSVGIKGSTYNVTIDYINSATINGNFWIRRSASPIKPSSATTVGAAGSKMVTTTQLVPLAKTIEPNFDPTSVRYEVSRKQPVQEDGFERVNIPIYVGIGLRVVSVVTVVEGGANISGLGTIGAEAEAKRLSGSLVVQTLGINGKSVTAALPIQSELNRTTAQAAIVSISQIKTLLYQPGTYVAPRIVGLYLPLESDPRLVRALVSSLADGTPTELKLSCRSAKGSGELGPTLVH
ncbi:MAG: hypothetical protein HYS27_09715 [Deltaproteobacteria bacterium]|nr:hypothetical protein [Deltaproteobacteria bacterium]